MSAPGSPGRRRGTPPSDPGRLRWLAAAVLAALPLAHAWEYAAGFPGTTTLINQYNPYTGGLDLVPYYIPGTSGELVYGFQSPVRLALVLAVAGALIAAAGSRGSRPRQVAIAALVVAFVLALSAHEGAVVLTLGLALVLVGDPLRRRVQALLASDPVPVASAPRG